MMVDHGMALDKWIAKLTVEGTTRQMTMDTTKRIRALVLINRK
jgi:hypothetical protein